MSFQPDLVNALPVSSAPAMPPTPCTPNASSAGWDRAEVRDRCDLVMSGGEETTLDHKRGRAQWDAPSSYMSMRSFMAVEV